MAPNWVELCFCPEVKFQIIQHFVRNPELRQNQTHIAKAVRRSAISISRNIQDLVRLQVLFEERHGRAAVYSLNQNSALVARFLVPAVALNSELIPKWVAQQVRALRASSRKLIDRVLLFGSAARGDMSAGSDIDLLVVVTRKAPSLDLALRSTLVASGSAAGFKINLQVESAQDFNSLRPTAYLRAAKAEGVILWRR